MSTDRDLLVLAARVAGLLFDPTRRDSRGLWVVKEGASCQSEQELWNSLTNDGQAARLLVALDIDVDMGLAGHVMAGRWASAGSGSWDAIVEVSDGAAPSVRRAAWRRAITLAAAACAK